MCFLGLRKVTADMKTKFKVDFNLLKPSFSFGLSFVKIVLIMYCFIILFIAGGLLRIKLEGRTWLLMTVMLSSLFMFMDAKILFYKFKVTIALKPF